MKKSTQSKKQKFRASKAWKELRHQKNVEQHGIDPITKKKLYKMANLHHKNLDPKEYENISDPSHFVMLNQKTHECVHFLFSYYKNDPEILDRLKLLLDEMVELNA